MLDLYTTLTLLLPLAVALSAAAILALVGRMRARGRSAVAQPLVRPADAEASRRVAVPTPIVADARRRDVA